MKDPLGDRMKSSYEDRTRSYLPRRTFTIIRLDGKSFHTYTKSCKKPFDDDLYEDMNNAIIAILPEIHGAVFAYTQSDEISILLTDFSSTETNAWFDGNIQKITSVSASMITAEFNKLRIRRSLHGGSVEGCQNVITLTDTAYFDARTFSIPDRTEVMNYFLWRNNDCSRNSVSMYGQHHFSHKQLQGQSTKQVMEMLADVNKPWDALKDDWKYGRLIVKENYEVPFPTGEFGYNSCGKNAQPVEFMNYVKRTRWVAQSAWKLVENKERLLDMVPKYE